MAATVRVGSVGVDLIVPLSDTNGNPIDLELATGLTLEVGIKPDIRATWDGEMPPDYAPAAIGFLPGDTDEYLITEGGLKGQRGFFTRDQGGGIVGVDIAGRMFSRCQRIPGKPSGLRRGCWTVRDLEAATAWRPSVTRPNPPEPPGRGAYRE